MPLSIEVEDGERLLRAVRREQLQAEPHYAELCRRFLADSEDFREENLKRLGIDRVFENVEIASCVEEIKAVILEKQKESMLY